MATKEKIFIPTYISDVNYNPARVSPRIFFYNGRKECEQYYIDNQGTPVSFTSFPYFDNYSGNVTTTSSLSLLFNNEVAPYGDIPTQSLYTQYWETYVTLLYNPRTRLINGSAIIPLAEYFKMELNDIVNFRGNYYHLRAINDYNLKTGECNIQLLGPILDDAFEAPDAPIDTGGGGSGTSGTSGTAGTAGTAGTGGTNGTSGTNGTEGTSGTNGTEGTSGTNGTEGTSGTSGEQICVTNFGASMVTCIGGTFDEYMEGYVDLSEPAPTDAEFTLEVGYIPGSNNADCNNQNTFTDLFVTVPSGSQFGLLTCPNAPFIDFNGATICSVTIKDGPYSECV